MDDRDVKILADIGRLSNDRAEQPRSCRWLVAASARGREMLNALHSCRTPFLRKETMRVVIISVGSRGDLQPFVALRAG